MGLTFQACEEAPFLKKFANDWPTQALAMQLLKNKWGHSYRRGYLEVPDKYAYLKGNAAKKKTQACRSAQVTPQLCGSEEGGTKEGADEPTDPVMVASGSKSKRAAPGAAATTQQPRKKKETDDSATLARTMAKGKGRQKASLIEAEVEEEEEEEALDKEEACAQDSDDQGDKVDMVDPEE
jgi:hypothetical protein